MFNGITESDIMSVTQLPCRRPCGQCNVVPLTREEYQKISSTYRNAWRGYRLTTAYLILASKVVRYDCKRTGKPLWIEV